MPESSPAKLLTKVFELELSGDCQDRAAIGGLASFVNSWLPSLCATAPQDQAEGIEGLRGAFSGYRDLTASERSSLVKKALGLLQQLPADQPSRRTRRPDGALEWHDPVTFLPGVGAARAKLLATLDIRTVGDLLLHCPLRYEDRSQLTPVAALVHRETHSVRVRIAGPGKIARRGKLAIVRVPAEDDTGKCTLIWFNQPYRASMYPPGTELLVTGQARLSKGRATLWVREAEKTEDLTGDGGQIVPLYAVTTGVSQMMLRRLIRQALESCAALPTGVVPSAVATRRDLPDLPWAIPRAHAPADDQEARPARARLQYEHLFALQCILARRRHLVKQHDERAVVKAEGVLAELVELLPFTLTAAQRRVAEQVLADLARPEPTYRLIHGDVGSGKTVIAAVALLAALRAGRQAAVMAPTEILAEQDWTVISQLLEPLGIKLALLTGSLPEAEKTALREELQAGEISCVVGTHALVQESVVFADLAVAVIDEQQRFGVAQRARLAAKGGGTNILVMSATPIPRTLALTAYGDFDVSVVDELPPGRQPVHTELLVGRQVRKAYETIIAHVEQGRQAYIVCPVIEQSKTGYLTAAEELFQRLRDDIFPNLRLGLVHGQMPAVQRETTMNGFRAGQIDVLVATSVVEVGMDVPNATVMMVQNAERFGLAQLHQLRGRVGRGAAQALCLLVVNSRTPEVIERIKVLEKTNDGFEIANEDLLRRGPGELTGSRQHGIPDLEMAGLLGDTKALAQAREDAFELIARDPDLRDPAHEPLMRYLAGHAQMLGDWTI